MKVRLDETLFKARAQENLAMTNEINKFEQVDALVECLDHFVADRKWVDEITRDELLTMVTQSHGDKDALIESVLAKFNTPCIDAAKLKECRERRQNKGLKESMKKRKSLKESDNRDTFTLDTSDTPILDCGLYYTLLGELDPGRYDERFKEFEDCVKECAEPILDELVRKTPNFEVVSVGTYYHPRYYNYETDSLEFTVKYTGDELGTVIEEYSNNQDFIDFLQNYKSYDGFISFYADNKEDFVTQDYVKSVSQIIKYNVTQEDYERANEELCNDVMDCGFYPEDEYEDDTDESLKEKKYDIYVNGKYVASSDRHKRAKDIEDNIRKDGKIKYAGEKAIKTAGVELDELNVGANDKLKVKRARESKEKKNLFMYRIYMKNRDKDYASGNDYKDAKSMLKDAKKDFELALKELRTNPKQLVCKLFNFVDGEYYNYKDLTSVKEIEDEIKLEATPSKKESCQPKKKGKKLKEEYTPSPMSATDFFDSFDFTIYKSTDEEGDPCYKLRDNQGANLGDIEDDTFPSISDAVDRLDIYYEDYIINDLSEIAPELSGLHSGNYEDVFNKIKDMDKTADGHSVRGHKALLYYILHPEQLKDDVRELTESKELKEGYYGQTLQDFLDDCMDYSIIDNIYIYGNNDVVYEGPIDDIPEDMLDTEFLECDMYTNKKSVVTVNVDSSEEYGAGIYEFLNEFLDDCNCELVVIYDLSEGEEIFNGYKEDIPEEYLEYAFASYDAPEEMSVNLNDYEGEDDFDESLKEGADGNTVLAKVIEYKKQGLKKEEIVDKVSKELGVKKDSVAHFCNDLKEDASPINNSSLARKMGAKFLPPKDYGIKKKKPRYVYEVYYYDTEDCTGDPIFRKFSSRKAQEEWYEKHKDDPDKFDMYAYPDASIYEGLKETYNTEDRIKELKKIKKTRALTDDEAEELAYCENEVDSRNAETRQLNGESIKESTIPVKDLLIKTDNKYGITLDHAIDDIKRERGYNDPLFGDNEVIDLLMRRFDLEFRDVIRVLNYKFDGKILDEGCGRKKIGKRAK